MFEQFNPEMIDILKELAASKCVEFLATPYAYSLASEYNEEEFKKQLKFQGELLETILGVKAQSVWNTELLYTDEAAYNLNKLGYKVILTEGAKHVLSWKTPNKVYQSAGAPKMKVLLRNTNLSDELSFHFSDPGWANFPMDAEKYADMLKVLPEGEDIVNIWVGAEMLKPCTSPRAAPGLGLSLRTSARTSSFCSSLRWSDCCSRFQLFFSRSSK